jgi:5'-3' exonuclease
VNSNKYKYILIDGNNLFWRSWATNIAEVILKDEKIYSGGIATFISRLNQLINMFSYVDDVKIYLLFDNPTSTIKVRQEIDENYKSHQLNKKHDKEIYKTIEILIRILKCYSDKFYIVNCPNCEADDLTLPLIKYLKISDDAFSDKVLCISNDLDWARNIDINIHWYNFNEVYTIDSFEKEYGFKPNDNKIKMYKAMRGDKSDNISIGLPYVKEDTVIDILNKYSTIDLLIDGLNISDYSDSVKKKIRENSIQLRTNYQLVDFSPIENDITEYISICKKRIGELKIWYKALDIELESWMKSKAEMQNSFLIQKKIKRVRS